MVSWSERAARVIVRQRMWIAAAWLAVAVVLLPAARRLPARLDVTTRVEHSESDSVAQILAGQFASPFARTAVVVVAGVPSPRDSAGRLVLRAVADAALRARGATRTVSYLDIADSAFVGTNGATYVLVGLDARAKTDSLIPELRTRLAECADSLRANHPRITLELTGEDALNHDLRRTSAADVSAAERRAMPLTLLLLVVAFGAVAAAFIPLTIGVLAIALALGGAAIVARVSPLSIVLQNVVSMLGLGLGVDYTLLLVSRFREARAAGRTSEDAAVDAAVHAGHSVLVSAAAVLVGFAGLLAVPLADLHSIAVGGLLVVTSSSLLAVTLVPGLLAWLGPRVDFLSVRRVNKQRASQRWRRWALLVSRRPLITLAIAGLPLVLLAAQATRLSPRLPRGNWLPQSAESARGMRALRAMGRGGVVQTMRVVLSFPPEQLALDPVGWRATQRIASALERDPRVARVRSLPAITNGIGPASPVFSFTVPELARTSLVSRNERFAQLEVVPAEGIDGSRLPEVARDLRTMDAAAIGGLPGLRMLVGGVPALNADYADAIARRTWLVVGLVVGGTFLALLVGFRSVLVPLKAVALNLLAVSAALGVVVLVFQDGHGARLLGLEGALDGTFAAVPLLVFCTVFGLSMDYEVFLISRVAEARKRGASEGAALVTGVARSGRVITSAAAIMVVVFGAFALGDFVLVKILGVALSAAVILDATLVRLAVGPALLAIAGRWNWWPSGRLEQRAESRELRTAMSMERKLRA